MFYNRYSMSEKFSTLLLSWFDKNARDLPWRHIGGAHPNPYIVLVSEIMLQQTTVKTVLSYFDRFMERFKTVEAFSDEEAEILQQGLLYTCQIVTSKRTNHHA